MARPASSYRGARRTLAKQFKVPWHLAQKEVTPWSGPRPAAKGVDRLGAVARDIKGVRIKRP